MPTHLSALRLTLAASAIVAVSSMTGCANMATTASSISTFSPNAVISGRVHGGNQPVSAADIRLYAAGTTGYGSAPTLYAVTTSANDGFGSFGFTKTAGAGATTTSVYGCPTGSDPQMYITAKGGNTQGAGNGTNTAAGFIVALGKCSTIGAGTIVDMNEVTTVGTMAALQQYFSPANANSDNLNHLGYPSSTQAATAFANGVATIGNLVVVGTGTVNTTSTTTGTPTGGTAAVTVTLTPEVAKINTLANILAACVNTTSNSSSACTTLFTDATPPNSAVTSQPALNFGTATDTLQAAYYMLTNPTSGSAANVNALFNLTSAQAPFQPMETAAPTDWTVGVKYASTSPCSAGANFLLYAYHLAVDATGNIWASSNATGGNLFELSPAGVPLTCALNTTVGTSYGFAFDVNGNVWIGGTANTNLYKYVPSTGAYTTWPAGVPTGTAAVVSDRSGNVVLSSFNSAAVFAFPNGANTTTPFTASQISSTTGTSPYFMAADTANRAFLVNATTSPIGVYDIYPSTVTTDATYSNGYETANAATSTTTANPYGVAAGLASTIMTANGNLTASAVSNTLSIFTPTSTAGTVNSTFVSAQYAGGINGPRELVVDGAGNAWVANSTKAAGNYVQGTTTGGGYSISEFSASGVALSPTGTGTTTATVTGGFQKDTTVLSFAPRGIVVDPSGNVWFGSNSGTGTSISELVGAAVPVVTPVAAALAAGVTTTNAVSKP